MKPIIHHWIKPQQNWRKIGNLNYASIADWASLSFDNPQYQRHHSPDRLRQNGTLSCDLVQSSPQIWMLSDHIGPYSTNSVKTESNIMFNKRKIRPQIPRTTFCRTRARVQGLKDNNTQICLNILHLYNPSWPQLQSTS